MSLTNRSIKLKDIEFQRRKVSVLAFSHFTHDLYTAFFAVLLPIIKERFALNYFMSGFLVFLMRSPSVIAPFAGALADRVSLRIFIAVTPAVTAITMSLLPISDSFVFVCILLFAAGASSAIYHIPTPVIIKQLSGNRIGKGMSYFMVGGETARFMGPLLVIQALALLGTANFHYVMIFGLIVSFILFYVLKDYPTGVVSRKNNNNKITASLKATLNKHRKMYLLILLIVICKVFVSIGFTAFLPTYLQSTGLSLENAGLGLILLEVAAAAGVFFTGRMSDHTGRRRILALLSLISTVMIIVFVYTNSFFMYPVLMLIGILAFTSGPILMAVLFDNEKKYPSSANSLIMAFNFVSAAIVSLVFGQLGDVLGMKTTYLISAGFSLLSVLFIMMLPKKNAGE
ncbi:MAG: MFS transporter [Candidatus Kapabacteria bacterium]|jgi:FSR family fosmidomycin resistance protein-like MFS transporter|nr:MFS transporter [Candidatus Kapabacteria bacterium]